MRPFSRRISPPLASRSPDGPSVNRMTDEPSTHTAPVPIRSHAGPRERLTPAAAVVQELRASLRTAEVYTQVLISRIELACASDLVRLDTVPVDAMVRLTLAAEAFQQRADRILKYIDHGLAQAAQINADLARQSVGDFRWENT